MQQSKSGRRRRCRTRTTLLVEGARDGSLVAQPDERSTSIALFGAVTSNALMHFVTENHRDETVVAGPSAP